MLVTGLLTCWRAWITLTRNASTALRLEENGRMRYNVILKSMANLPNIISINPGDENLSFMVVHKETTNHDPNNKACIEQVYRF